MTSTFEASVDEQDAQNYLETILIDYDTSDDDYGIKFNPHSSTVYLEEYKDDGYGGRAVLKKYTLNIEVTEMEEPNE